MNRYLLILISLVFLSLLITKGESYLSIAAIIALGLISAVIQRLFVGYLIPTKGIFRLRFAIYGIGFGLMIGLLMLLINSIREQSFEISDLTRWIVISIPLGVIIFGSKNSYDFKELKQRTNGEEDQPDTTSDLAFYRDAENTINRGRLLLSGGKLSFHSSELEGCLFEIEVVDLNAVIHPSKFMGIPNGFSLPDERGWVQVAFPYYWLKLMKAERKKVTAHA